MVGRLYGRTNLSGRALCTQHLNDVPHQPTTKNAAFLVVGPKPTDELSTTFEWYNAHVQRTIIGGSAKAIMRRQRQIPSGRA